MVLTVHMVKGRQHSMHIGIESEIHCSFLLILGLKQPSRSLPHVQAQGVKQSICPSAIVVAVIIENRQISSYRHLCVL